MSVGRERMVALVLLALSTSCDRAPPEPSSWTASALTRGEPLACFQTAGPRAPYVFAVRNTSADPTSRQVVRWTWGNGSTTTSLLACGEETTGVSPGPEDSKLMLVHVTETQARTGRCAWRYHERR